MNTKNTFFKRVFPKEDERKAMEKAFSNNTFLEEGLLRILEDKMPIIREADFAKAAWPYLRAYQDGQVKVLKELKNLFTTKETTKGEPNE